MEDCASPGSWGNFLSLEGPVYGAVTLDERGVCCNCVFWCFYVIVSLVTLEVGEFLKGHLVIEPCLEGGSVLVWEEGGVCTPVFQ